MNATSEPTLNPSLEHCLGESAYNTLLRINPRVLSCVIDLLDRKQTPNQIARFVQGKDIYLAAIVEMAAEYMLSTGTRPPR